MDKCSCPVDRVTTYHEDYPQFEARLLPVVSPKSPCDQELISGHNENSLQINGQRIKSKVWPNMQQHSEEYQHFLERLKRCKNHIYNLYFQDPPVDKSVIANMFKDLSKTAYQLQFSPDVFEPRKEARRFSKANQKRIDMKYQETTYNTYFSRIKELERFRDTLYGVILSDNRKELKSELQKVYRCGVSTYNDTISQPGSIYAKPTLPGPIDRYTCRRI